MTAVCALAIWILLCVLVLVVPAVARIIGAAVLILIMVGLALALASPADAPQLNRTDSGLIAAADMRRPTPPAGGIRAGRCSQ